MSSRDWLPPPLRGMQTLNHRPVTKIEGSRFCICTSLAMELLNSAPNKILKMALGQCFRLFNFCKENQFTFTLSQEASIYPNQFRKAGITFGLWSTMTSYPVLPICLPPLRQQTNPHKLAPGRSCVCLNYTFGWHVLFNHVSGR